MAVLVCAYVAPGRWVEDMTSVGTADRRGLKAHLSGGPLVVVPNGLEMAFTHQRNGGRKKRKTSPVASLSVIAVEGRDTPGYGASFIKGEFSSASLAKPVPNTLLFHHICC